MTEILRGVRTPDAEYCAQSGLAQFWPTNINFASKVIRHNQKKWVTTAVLAAIIFLFEIGQKIADL